MESNELPLGFGFALAQDPAAMERFAALNQCQQITILRQANSVSSKEEMQALIDRLCK